MRVNSPTSKTILYKLLNDSLAKYSGPRTKSIINTWRAGRRIKRSAFSPASLYLPPPTLGSYVSRNLWKLNQPKPKPSQPGFWHTLFNKGWDAATAQTAQQFKDMSFWDKLKWSLGFSTGFGSEKGPGFFQTLLTPFMGAYLAFDTGRLYNKANLMNQQIFNKYIQMGELNKARELFPKMYQKWQFNKIKRHFKWEPNRHALPI